MITNDMIVAFCRLLRGEYGMLDTSDITDLSYDTLRELLEKVDDILHPSNSTNIRPDNISFSSGTWYEGKKILERLRSGDRLIAYSAAGVSWMHARVQPYEFPNKAALQYLLDTKQIGNPYGRLEPFELVELEPED